jgi:hypothetical protein
VCYKCIVKKCIKVAHHNYPRRLEMTYYVADIPAGWSTSRSVWAMNCETNFLRLGLHHEQLSDRHKGRKNSSGFGALFKAAVSSANGVAIAEASQNSGGGGGRGEEVVVAGLWWPIRVTTVAAST